ncbi:hypothetical protein HV819_04835 [Anaerococcus sp. AGMB00486]|uniref:Transposase n=2 Tax=Anaerococcus TaxID=165779 RepID=A0ABX2N9D6_9FIRM|nr:MULTISPECIES: hypothetical protein [Anaerococcus]MSS78459.1 hypothetical protein [Anaerococcus porci]NVF11315.1 hypothetical protein [Anaerococcus faecalis]
MDKHAIIRLRNHKQSLSAVQIHKMILDKGYDISYPSIAAYVRKKRNKTKECFIKQQYDFADRLEYDFGEVKLLIDGKLEKLNLAVMSSPAQILDGLICTKVKIKMCFLILK